MTESAPLERVVARLGRYQLLLRMAAGGMATVYLARLQGPESFEKLVVIKQIHDHLARDPEFVKMFLDEARISARIQHPNVVGIFEMGEVEGTFFIAMEYVHGQTLRDIITMSRSKRRPYHWAFCARIIADAAAGLHAAHEATDVSGEPLGIVHRDVSLQNILVGHRGHVKVVDFGVAYASQKLSSTAVGTLKGKVPYMSPEQASQAPMDRRSDIFSLGTCFYELVTRKRLFVGPTEVDTLLNVRRADVPSIQAVVPGAPSRLDQIVRKALARDPRRRFATAAELKSALEHLLVELGEVAGAEEVAAEMEVLFAEQQRLKDEQIAQALLEESSRPRSFVGPIPGEISKIGSVKRLIGGKRWPFAALAAAASLVAAIAIWGWPRQERSPAPPSTAIPQRTAPMKATMAGPVRQMKADPARPQKITLEVTVRPAKASAVFTFRGRRYAGSPWSIRLPVSDSPEKLGIAAAGYQRESVLLIPDRDRTVTVTLRKRKRAGPRPRPRRRPALRWKD